MDNIILFLYQNLWYVFAFAAVLIMAKFFVSVIYFRGNVVDSVLNFFAFYSPSNIKMTETSRARALKTLNNILNMVIYLFVLVFIIVYFIHPEPGE